MTTHPQTRRALARKAILKAGKVTKPKDKGKAFNRVAGHFEYSRQAVERWYREGKIPRGCVEKLAALAELMPHQVDPVEFPESAQAEAVPA